MKMKIIKKNQLAILVISLMLITAGYLNYDTNYNSNAGMEASAGLEGSEALDLASLRRCRACKYGKYRGKSRDKHTA